MTRRPTPQPGILNIAPYVAGKASAGGSSDVLKLSSNENPLGCSDAAKAAYARAGHELHRYPPTDHGALHDMLAETYGLDASRMVCGVGSDEVLQFIAQAFAGAGDEVIYTEHGFSMYPLLAHAVGAKPVMVPETDRRVDVDLILKAVTDRTKIVFIANPGNPTGTMISMDEVARLAKALPGDVVLVHDGAYTEYVEGSDGGAALVEASENVIVTRTFSKIYGLGGLRIGWGYGPKAIIDALNRIRQPFNLSDAQLQTAIAALKDQAFVDHSRSSNAENRAWLTQALAELGVQADPSETNFILARFGDQAEAEACDEWLQAAGILVRRVAGYALPDCLRITVGDKAGCRRVAHAIGAFKEARS